MISTAFITNVTSVGELKFEVVTNNRTFIFRAESDGVNMSYFCSNMHLASHVCLQITIICFFIHMWSHPFSWEKWMGYSTARLHQGAPSAKHHGCWLTFEPRLSGLFGVQRITLQTLYCCCFRQSLPLQKYRGENHLCIIAVTKCV